VHFKRMGTGKSSIIDDVSLDLKNTRAFRGKNSEHLKKPQWKERGGKGWFGAQRPIQGRNYVGVKEIHFDEHNRSEPSKKSQGVIC